MPEYTVTFRKIVGVLALCLLTLQFPSPERSERVEKYSFSATPGRSNDIRIPVFVEDSTIPVRIGVPVSESASLTDISGIGVTDRNGHTVPSSLRVLARWKGTVEDNNRPVKWLLIDFCPREPGIHYVTNGQQLSENRIRITDNEKSIRISNPRLELVLSKSGNELLKSFILNGREAIIAPVKIQMKVPRRALISRIEEGRIIVTDPSVFRPGDGLRFEHRSNLIWDAASGSRRLVTKDRSLAARRLYRLSEGTDRQEDIKVTEALPGDLRTETPLKFSHKAGSSISDIDIEKDTATIKSIEGQMLNLTGPVGELHVSGESVDVSGSSPIMSFAKVLQTKIEESNPVLLVIRQDGHFNSPFGQVPAKLSFTLRYFIFADKPYIRVQLRLTNMGSYGFGASRTGRMPFAEHALISNLSVIIHTAPPAANKIAVSNGDEARRLVELGKSEASISTDTIEITVPEFAENYPRSLFSDSSGLRFEVLPFSEEGHIFDGARAKSVDFYIGKDIGSAHKITNSQNASLDPHYVASTRAVRPSFTVQNEKTKDEKSGFKEVRDRLERMISVGYAVELAEGAGAVPPMSVFEYRIHGESGEHFGWRNFGDLAWGDGYANVHYDLPFLLLREYLRTADPRAFRLGSEMARYRAGWGQHHSDDFFDRDRTWNFKGMAFYEKGDHGSFREPVPSHMWIEGLWLYWAMTGDEDVYRSALDGSMAFARMKFSYENSLGWNEPRWIGWPILGLITAYRYTGRAEFLTKARDNINLLIRTEEESGRKGYYIGNSSGFGKAVQPWAWCYSLAGVIEYHRDTGDRRVADFLVRVADWLIGKGSENPPLKPGRQLNDGTYLPEGVSYFWYPDKTVDDRSVALAGMCLPVITTAAKITGRDDLWLRARRLARDYSFYRDLPEGIGVDPKARAIINFRSLLFASSSPKVYGQMGLTVTDSFAELFGNGK